MLKAYYPVEESEMISDVQKVPLIEHILELEERMYHVLRPIVPKEWICVNLTTSQLKIILLIFADGPARMSALASALHVSLATVTGITDNLFRHDLIVRGRDPKDRRAVICGLSDQGKKLVTRLWDSGQSRVRSVLEKITPSKLEIINEAMEVVLQSASAMEQDTDIEA